MTTTHLDTIAGIRLATLNKYSIAIFLIFAINNNLIEFVNGSLNSDSSDSSDVYNLNSNSNNNNNNLINFQICNLNGNDSALKQLGEKLVHPDNEFSDYLDKDKTKRYTLTLSHATPLTINITSMCQNTAHLTLSWNLFYRNKINFDNLIRENINHSEIIEFKCLPSGRYDFLVTSIGISSCKWKFLFRLAQYNHNWPYLNLTKPIKIHLKNRQQKRQIIVKWEKSKLDIHAINYCMAINREKSYTTLCDAIHSSATSSIFNEPEFTLASSSTSLSRQQPHQHTATTPSDKENICNSFYTIENLLKFTTFDKVKLLSNKKHTEIICTGFKSQQIFRDFQLKLPYYIDVYAIHTKLNNFSYFLGGLRTIINRTQPLLLREDKTTIHKLNEINGIFLFSIKLKQSQNANFQLFVIPCGGGGSIDIKIIRRKDKIFLKKNIYKPTILKIMDSSAMALNGSNNMLQNAPGAKHNSGIKFANRYVIKIRPSTEDDIMRVHKVELTYTTKEYFNEFPVLPKNITIVEFVGSRNCRATTIAWYSSPDIRKVKYCVYILRLSMKNRDFDNVKQISFCEIDTNLSTHEEFQQMYCFYPEKRTELETLRILDLTPGRQYYVHLTASLPNGKSLPYESIRIKTHAKCRKGTMGAGGGSGGSSVGSAGNVTPSMMTSVASGQSTALQLHKTGHQHRFHQIN